MRMLLLLSLLLLAAPSSEAATLVEVARGDRLWTGLAVSPTGRVFVNYPRWSMDLPLSVAELDEDGVARAYPDTAWQRWTPGADPARHFVCVQSVHVDGAGRLWILDTGNPWLRGVVEGGAKLLRVDLEDDAIERTYSFDLSVAPAGSYLNDLRVDVEHETVYLTESGLGALVVLDLRSGAARRVLSDHPSTKAQDTQMTVGGQPFPMRVHADGIALDAEGGWLYWQALTGRTLYRLPTEALRDPALDDAALAARIQTVAESGVSDGLLFADGGVYVSALEHDAIRFVDPAAGTVSTVVADPRIRWPDSFALGPDGSVWFTTSQIHLGPRPGTPYGIFRIER